MESAAKGLLNEVNQFKFIAITHLMMDILPFISRLSKQFEKEIVDFSCVKQHIESTCACLKDMTEVNGVFVDKLSNFVQVNEDKVTYIRPLSESDSKSLSKSIEENVACEGFSDDETSEDESENVGYSPEMRYYAQQKDILSNVAPDYLSKLTTNLENRFIETEILECMKVIIPQNICTSDSVASYGMEEIKQLATHFVRHISKVEDVITEFMLYKRLV